MQELGSEFWENSKIESNYVDTPYRRNLLSGRTAIDYIIRDIKLNRIINSVLIPSYCCESMLEPFLRNNIKLSFYNPFDLTNITEMSDNVDAILIIDYFGYHRIMWNKILDTIDDSKVVIYDSTQSLLGNKEIENRIDYSFISYRKWYFTNHCIVKKYKSKFNLDQPIDTNNKYINLRQRASEYKKNYIEKSIGNKDDYLKLFNKAELILESNYVEYLGIPSCTSISDITFKRRENAKFLIDRIKNIPNIELLYNCVENTDIPLFVPIIVKINRDLLRAKLIDNRIYCPVHWSFSKLHQDYLLNNTLYSTELSLICDQRYNIVDMERQVKIIEEFSLEMK